MLAPQAMKRQNARRLLRGVLVGVIIGLMPGCQEPDTRIDLHQLTNIEQQLEPNEPVAVNTADLALAEVQPYRVQVGDVLSLQLVGLAEDRYAPTTLQVRVHEDGTISLPAVGELSVAGLELGAVEKAIIDAHVPDIVRDLAVFVELTNSEKTTVLVLGAADAPGLVRLSENERNVLYAIASAGGFTRNCSGRVRVRPVRPDQPERKYDLTKPDDVRRALLATPLQSGDVIKVEAATESVVYLVGLVNSPGPVPIPAGTRISTMQAIASAGGLVDFLEPDEATLWRQLDDGREVRVKLDLAALTNGELSDLALQRGDILEIPHTPKTRFRQWLAQNIQIGPFGITAVYDPVADYRARIISNQNDDSDVFRRTLLQSVGTGVAEIVIPPVAPPVAP